MTLSDVAYQENGENELAQERVKRDNKYIALFKALGCRHLIPFSSLLLLLHTNRSHSQPVEEEIYYSSYEKFFPGRKKIIEHWTDAMRVKNTFWLCRVILVVTTSIIRGRIYKDGNNTIMSFTL